MNKEPEGWKHFALGPKAYLAMTKREQKQREIKASQEETLALEKELAELEDSHTLEIVLALSAFLLGGVVTFLFIYINLFT